MIARHALPGLAGARQAQGSPVRLPVGRAPKDHLRSWAPLMRAAGVTVA